ncbi:MAG TPA: hypothetical protein VMM78_10570 [Thermomicrobiales bacterium]|nr:hypothetical protein [Thermomicrobiales bacterium]
MQRIAKAARYDQASVQRTVTDVGRAEDGGSVEVEDPKDVRLTCWIADSGCVPHVGDIARFYGGASGQPVSGPDINGCRVFRVAG